MLKAEIKPISRKSNLVVQELNNEVLVYDLLVNKAFNLNETSVLIWQLCNGNNTISDIARIISQRFSLPVNEDLVWLALEQLKKENLLENAEEVSIDFGGLSRREIIRKIGFATLVVLPVISALIAPAAIKAQSSNCVALLATGCTPANFPCCSGLTCNPQPGGQPNNYCCISGNGDGRSGENAGSLLDLGTVPQCTDTTDKDGACQTNRGTECCDGNAEWNGANCNGNGAIRCVCS